MKQKLVSFKNNEPILSCLNLFMVAALTCLSLFSFAGEKKDTKEPGAGKNQSVAGETNKMELKKEPQNNNDSEYYIKPNMIYVPCGRYRMGSTKGKNPEEIPEHIVNMHGFWIGKYEVTVGEFRKFMNSHTYITDAEKAGFSYVFDGKTLITEKSGVNWGDDVLGNKRLNEDNHPVIHVSWNDAIAYCNWLSKLSGKTYRLPTEAEWEYAAKGGDGHGNFIYSGGNNMDSVGWYDGNSGLHTHPVGQKSPNELGIYDMSGNVWEWCADWYGPYSEKEQTNPTGPVTGDDKVLRGGGWRFFATRTRSAARRNCLPAFNGSGIGFRLAASE